MNTALGCLGIVFQLFAMMCLVYLMGYQDHVRELLEALR